MRLLFLTALTIVLLLTSFLQKADASHTWGGYHWARTSNPFTLKLVDNLSTSWDPFLATTSADWSASNVLDTTITTGFTNPRNCRPTAGRVEVCNYRYGNNGWLGIAQIWVSGGHITQGSTKVNDTYFTTAKYNTPSWKNLVMCQEIGHTFGLNHQDEVFNNTNLGSCMDYTDDPSGAIKSQSNNEHPNVHDYEQLGIIYAHLDGFTSIQNTSQKLPLGQSIANAAKEGSFENRSEWGKSIRDNGYVALFERDLGEGIKLFTFTIWAK